METSLTSPATTTASSGPMPAVIRDVASLKNFRTVALKNGVAEEWIGRVESTIVEYLRAWEEDGK